LIQQAATLCFGLIKNHPWQGGNKRTATVLTNEFLKRNGWRIKTSTDDLIKMVLGVESDTWKVDEIENWLRDRVEKIF
jgi:death-on-curing protein